MIAIPVTIPRVGSTYLSIFCNCFLVVVLGLAWGLGTVSAENSVSVASFVLERIFLVSWVLKYYPQLYMNACRKSTIGNSIDCEYLQAIGFISFGVYSAYEVEAFSDPNGVTLTIEVFRVLLSIHGLICSSLIIFQMYFFHGYRQSIHKGLNKLSNLGGFLVSTFVFFNILYLILLFVRQARGGMVVSRHQYFAAFIYCAAVFLSIRWISQIQRNFVLKSCRGLSLSSISMELVGSTCLLAAIICDGFTRSAFQGSSYSSVPSNLVSLLAEELLLSSIAGFSISSCLFLLAQAALYSGNNVTLPRYAPSEADGNIPEVAATVAAAVPVGVVPPDAVVAHVSSAPVRSSVPSPAANQVRLSVLPPTPPSASPSPSPMPARVASPPANRLSVGTSSAATSPSTTTGASSANREPFSPPRPLSGAVTVPLDLPPASAPPLVGTFFEAPQFGVSAAEINNHSTTSVAHTGTRIVGTAPEMSQPTTGAAAAIRRKQPASAHDDIDRDTNTVKNASSPGPPNSK